MNDIFRILHLSTERDQLCRGATERIGRLHEEIGQAGPEGYLPFALKKRLPFA